MHSVTLGARTAGLDAVCMPHMHNAPRLPIAGANVALCMSWSAGRPAQIPRLPESSNYPTNDLAGAHECQGPGREQEQVTVVMRTEGAGAQAGDKTDEAQAGLVADA